MKTKGNMKYVKTEAEKAAETEAPLGIELGPDDALIWLRADGKPHEFIAAEPELARGAVRFREPFLLGYGLSKLLNDEGWRARLVESVKAELRRNIHGH